MATSKPGTKASKPVKSATGAKRSSKKDAAPVQTPTPVPTLAQVVQATQKAVAPQAARRAGGKDAAQTGPTKATKAAGARKSAKASAQQLADRVAADALDSYEPLASTPAAGAAAATPVVDGGLERKLAKQPPRALNSPIRVFQMYSESWQRELLDSAFYALDVSRVDAHTLSLSVWAQLQANAATQGAQLWGAVSWRFAERTGMNGADWVRQIEAQPGADVYFSSADVQHEAVFHNPWLQAQTQYPRFLELARAFLEATGQPPAELSVISPSALSATGDMLVGSPAFWAAYIPWLRSLLVTADKRMAPALRDLLHAPVPGTDAGLTYLALIIERLLPVFLRGEGKGLKAAKIALPERERELNVHQKLLREMKDVAHRTQSAWLAACWVNYRNLYLGQTQSKAWVQQHLRAITPTEIKFG